MAKKSAGLLMFRYGASGIELFLVHPGGPFWRGKDLGAWTIPKGECLEGEESLQAAKREFEEETGVQPREPYRKLTPLKQPGGKTISAWAFEGDCDPAKAHSNTFTMEWPPKSGLQSEFPEVDKADWFPLQLAREKIIKGQAGFIDELCALLDAP
ncbi:NUDIX domain-containing protein [Geomonas sp. RF6]|uniref:NUDIX domain-containing protein n=1 Tax=Geomonas sp. RF6 TaxID=2897342 RepID=UPI001E4D16D4|nr:NUDIX domain-containing protein [Geomonas sp. RF6]UFS68557.1 NUDIX domain-containing protein [Geomonas sp. RF6]